MNENDEVPLWEAVLKQMDTIVSWEEIRIERLRMKMIMADRQLNKIRKAMMRMMIAVADAPVNQEELLEHLAHEGLEEIEKYNQLGIGSLSVESKRWVDFDCVSLNQDVTAIARNMPDGNVPVDYVETYAEFNLEEGATGSGGEVGLEDSTGSIHAGDVEQGMMEGQHDDYEDGFEGVVKLEMDEDD
jgi:hypothetical protein